VRIDILLNAQDGNTAMVFKNTNLGSPQDWAEFSEVLQRIWGRVLNNLKAKLEAKPGK